MEFQRPDSDYIPTPSEHCEDVELPQCRIKRNYSCTHCIYFTQNPRFYLSHLRDIHGERIVINKCNLCLYASRHYQKLVRHMKMVHGSTEGITGQLRKRPPVEDSAWNQLQKKTPVPPSPPLLFPLESNINFANLPNDLELSRKSLKDIAALYFAENQIDEFLTQMEEADSAPSLLPPPPPPLVPSCDLSVAIKRKACGSTFFDELKKSFVDEHSLACNCGYVSKCFSESIIHQKSCGCLNKIKQTDEMQPMKYSSGSTRCQQCRRRCKSSMDLLKHLENCSQADHLQNESSNSISDVTSKRQELDDVSDDSHSAENGDGNKVSALHRSDVSEDGVNRKCEIVDAEDENEIPKVSEEVTHEDKSYFALETAPGYGVVTNKMMSEQEATTSSLKKVFKCPCCSFWASTASRFHVHIVGHLNKKPFKCSLCAYSSNWRWDITKHIRIKSIRNPNHKNARVIMGDETGRRNYTKYNKYLTLMKVTNEDGDSKQIRSGEMTRNQEASLTFLNDFNKGTSESEQLNLQKDTVDSASIPSMLCTQFPAGNKRSTPPLTRCSDDLITDVKTEGLEKKTFYNCRKCYFRHANRDAVLVHVKIHHQHSGSPLKSNLSTSLKATVKSKSINMNKDFAAALCLSQKKEQEQKQKSHSDVNKYDNQFGSVTRPISSLLEQDTPSKETIDEVTVTTSSNPTASATAPSSPSASTADSTSSFIGGGSKLSPLIGVTKSTNFVNETIDRRGPSPFRCGHCHQVSNWKHVIQRHCRLKHSGHIQIEAFVRSSDGHAPVYRPLDFDGNSQSRHLLGSSANAMKACQPQQQHMAPNTNSELSMSKSEYNSQDPSVSSSNSDSEITRLPLKPNPTTKQMKCLSCPFQQLNFHISLHNPMQYKCNQCLYICTKKQHLSSHAKIHDKPVTVDLKEQNKSCDDENPLTTVAVKVISYCPRCPESFVNSSKNLQQHLKAHGADLDFKCDICDFSTQQEAILLSHSFVHSNTHQAKSEQIAKDGKEDSEYPAKKMQQIILPKTGVNAWVVAESNENSFDNDGVLSKKHPECGSVKDSATSSSVLEKCPHCPFQSVCHKSLQLHLQYHIRVSKQTEEHVCEYCDFSTSSKCNLDEHTRIHFKTIDSKKSVSTFTSHDSLELIVADNYGKKDEEHKPMNRVSLSDSKVEERIEKTDREMTSTMRRSRRACALKDVKKSLQTPSSHKTILVNPKTGQVIKRK